MDSLQTDCQRSREHRNAVGVRNRERKINWVSRRGPDGVHKGFKYGSSRGPDRGPGPRFVLTYGCLVLMTNGSFAGKKKSILFSLKTKTKTRRSVHRI